MTVEEQELKPRHRIYVPSKTKADVPIPDNIRKDFYDFIVGRFSQHKIGSTVIPNAIGTYSSDTGKEVKESISIIESTGVFPFSEKELSLWCRHLDQEYILVEIGDEGGLIKAYHYNGEIKPFNDFELKINTGSIGYSIELNPEQFIHQGDYEVEVLDIREKYVISCFSYDEIGQPEGYSYLREGEICQLMSECDTNTYLLLECLVKQIDKLNSI